MPAYQPLTRAPSAGTVSQAIPSNQPRRQAIVGLILHGILVAIHAVLVVVHFLGQEHRVTFDPGRATDRAMQIITAASQIFGTVYAAILLLVTQQQALWRDFHSPITLTALHDRSTAWLGIGSSLNTLYRQFRLSTTVFSVLQVFLYLAGIFAIHITTPALFGIENTTELLLPRQHHTVLAPANYDPYPPGKHNIWLGALDIFRPGEYGASNPAGLVSNKVYDIPTVSGATYPIDEGYITLNATQFRVSCGVTQTLIQGFAVKLRTNETAEQTIKLYPSTANGTKFRYINASLPLYSTRSLIISLSVGLLATAPLPDYNLPMWVVTTNATLTDDAGMRAQPLDLPEPLFYNGVVPTQFSLLMCELFALHGTVNMSYPAGDIVDSERVFSTRNVSEDYFARTLKNSTITQQDTHDLEYATWLSQAAPPSTLFLDRPDLDPFVCSSDMFPCSSFTPVSSYVIDCISSTTSQLPTHSNDVPRNLSIPAIEDCLSRAMAVLAWQGRNIASPRPQENSPVTVQERRYRSRLNLNPIPLFLGLGTSIALLLLTYLLTRPHHNPITLNEDLTNPGILQITWLMGHQPDFARRVADVEVPCQDALREAGIFLLRWDEPVHNCAGPPRDKPGPLDNTMELGSCYGDRGGALPRLQAYQLLAKCRPDGTAPPAITSTWDRDKLQRALILILHGVLVAIHVALVVVFHLRLEHSITVRLGRATTIASQGITATSQLLTTVYTATLVLITQQQALWRDFHSPITLTALHDRSMAWLGIGSSLNTLYRQLRFPTTILSVLQIFLYLAAIFTVHITVPVMFNLENSTELHAPLHEHYNVLAPAMYVADLNENVTFEDGALISALGIFRPGEYGVNNPVGLVADKVYDTLAMSSAMYPIAEGFITLNATQPRFTCSVPQDSRISLIRLSEEENNTTYLAASPGTTDGTIFSFINITFPEDSLSPILIPPTTGPFAAAPISDTGPAWAIATNLTLTDNGDEILQPLQLPEPLFYNNHTPAQFQLLVCHLLLLHGTVKMSYPSGEIIDADRRFNATNVSESQILLTGWFNSNAVFGARAIFFANLALASLAQNPDMNNICQQIPKTKTIYYCYDSNDIASYVTHCTQSLAPESPIDSSGASYSTTVSAIEDCLSQAAAVLLWQVRNVRSLSPQQNGTIVIQELLRRSRLNLNPIPLFVGLGASILLLILACLLTWPHRTPKVLHKELTNPGILQIAWLIGRYPHIAERLAEVEEPTLDALREAGMFQLRWDEAGHSSSRPSDAESGAPDEFSRLEACEGDDEASSAAVV